MAVNPTRHIFNGWMASSAQLRRMPMNQIKLILKKSIS
jgi:hypothetical protein